MADINFKCPHCGQDLNGPEEMAGESIDCPVCKKNFQIPGGIIEVPKSQMDPTSTPPAPEASAPSAPVPEPAPAPAPAPVVETPSAPEPAPALAAPVPRPATEDEKGKTVRIELPPEFLAEPDKHIFKIKRIQR